MVGTGARDQTPKVVDGANQYQETAITNWTRELGTIIGRVIKNGTVKWQKGHA